MVEAIFARRHRAGPGPTGSAPEPVETSTTTTIRWYAGPPVEQIRAGKLVRVDAGGRNFVVFAVGDAIYALDDRCSHRNESLSEVGAVDDGELECCVHGARFDPVTGDARCLPATRALATAQVRVSEGRIEVGVAGKSRGLPAEPSDSPQPGQNTVRSAPSS